MCAKEVCYHYKDITDKLEGDNLDATQGLAVCDEDKGIFCCQRDFDCCSNTTLHLNLGHGEVLRKIVRPTSAAGTEEPEPEGKNHTKDMVVGVASGFSIAACLAIVGWMIVFLRRRLRQKAKKNAEASATRFGKAELDAIDTVPDLRTNPFRVGGPKNPAELPVESNARMELDTCTPTSTSMTRTASESHTVSPMTPGSATDFYGTLVTPVVVEMEAWPTSTAESDRESKKTAGG
jgi:hypothetical protein